MSHAAAPSAPDAARHLASLPLTTALWWFIENVTDDTPDRTALFFQLRERVRTEPATPVILMDVEGGVIHDVTATAPCRLIVLDADCDGLDETDNLDGYDVHISDHPLTGLPQVDDVANRVARVDKVLAARRPREDVSPAAAARELPGWLASLRVGNRVFWVDPDRDSASSGYYEVARLDCAFRDADFAETPIALSNEAFSEAEVLPSELWDTEPRVLASVCEGGYWSNTQGWTDWPHATLFHPQQEVALAATSGARPTWLPYTQAQALRRTIAAPEA